MEFFTNYKLVFLWTDFLVVALFAALVGFIYLVKNNKNFKIAWFKACRTPMQIIAITVLCFYLLIAVLDSIHFREALKGDIDNIKDYSTSVVSVLDKVLSPIGEQTEKTYSAPFSLYSFNPDLIKTATGFEWQNQRLEYAGINIDKNKDKYIDILRLILIGGLKGTFICIFALAFFSIFIKPEIKANLWCYRFVSKQKLYCDYHKITFWNVFLNTLMFLIILSFICYSLMQNYHILGTDKVGKDVFFAAIKSIRTGVVIGVLTTLIMLPFAIIFGTMAGYYRGIVDDAIQYLYTTISSVPGVLLIAASILILQVYIDKHAQSYTLMLQRTDLRLLTLCFILGVTGWIGLCRLLRGETLKLREENYILASRALGVSNIKIILKHIVPNLSHIILIAVALDFSSLVLAEAVLSYVGVGVDPSTYSWGNMINGARMEMAREPIVWWSLAGAFIFMFVLVLAANIFSDGVRDALDPRVEDYYA